MAHGTVRWFKRNYGFICQDDNGKDIFVHFSGIEEEGRKTYRKLLRDQKVEFDIAQTKKGPMAINVKVTG